MIYSILLLNTPCYFSNLLNIRYKTANYAHSHKLRCNRDPMAPGSKPCQRCVKAKSQCIISSSFRPGKHGAQDMAQELCQKSPEDDAGIQLGKKRKSGSSSGTPFDEERIIRAPDDNCMSEFTCADSLLIFTFFYHGSNILSHSDRTIST